MSNNTSFIIDHFDDRMEDARWNDEKFQFVEQLMEELKEKEDQGKQDNEKERKEKEDKKKVVLVTSVHPLYFFSFDKGQIFVDETRKKWERLLNGFEYVVADNGVDSVLISSGVHSLKASIDREKGFDPVLKITGESVEKYYSTHSDVEKDEILEDEVIDDMMERSRRYYTTIWNNCSSDERRVLIQIAQFGYVNSKNIAVVRKLLRARILVRRPALRLMNESFRRFVLLEQKPEDTAMSKDELRESPWRRLKMPFLIVLSGIIVFLFVTQQQVQSSTLKFVSAAAALIPVVIKLMALMQNGRSSKSSES